MTAPPPASTDLPVIATGDFKAVLGCFPTGVTVVTTVDGDGAKVAVTVNSFTSLSLDPPLVLFCMDLRSGRLAAFRQAGLFAVSILADDQAEIAQRFSCPDCQWHGVRSATWETGAPILIDGVAAIDCRLHDLYEAGDHVIIVGRVLRLGRLRDRPPLAYLAGRYGDFLERATATAPAGEA